MSPTKRVVVLGATGNVGRPLVSALFKAGFDVTAASRSADVTFSEPVKTAQVNMQSKDALVELFSQNDAIIEAFNPAAASLQSTIVEAALQSGIKHLITPDFACDTFNKDAGDLLIYDPKREAQKELEARIQGTNLKWTAIITGGWYDWAIPIGWFWINPMTNTITVYGSGNQLYSISRVGTAGRTVVDVLSNPEKYANRPVYVADYTVSTNQIIPLLEEIRPGWTVNKVEVSGFYDEARKKWDEDTKAGVTNRLATIAYAMLGTAGLFDEHNKYEADFSHKVEPGYEKSLDDLKEELRELVALCESKGS